MKHTNASRTAYTISNPELLEKIAPLLSDTFTPTEVTVILLLAAQPRTRAELFNLAEQRNMRHGDVEKALSALLEIKLVTTKTTYHLIKQEIKGTLLVDPSTNKITFTPQIATQPLVTALNVNFDKFDFDGNNEVVIVGQVHTAKNCTAHNNYKNLPTPIEVRK